jgi:hypothetical protein
MNAEPTPPPFRPRGPGPGCFLKGCLTLFIVFMVMGVIIGSVGYYVYSAALPFMSEDPGRIRVSPATPEQYQSLIERLRPFSEALETGHAATAELTADDLNTLIARDPQLEDLRGRLYFSIVNERLAVDVSTPVNDVEVNGPKVFFTGRLTVDASIVDGDLTVVLRNVEGLNGKPLPPLIERFVTGGGFVQNFEQGVRDRIQAQGQLPALMDRIKTARIENNHILVTCGEQAPAAEPPPSATPTPNPGVVAADPFRR